MYRVKEFSLNAELLMSWHNYIGTFPKSLRLIIDRRLFIFSIKDKIYISYYV